MFKECFYIVQCNEYNAKYFEKLHPFMKMKDLSNIWIGM